MSSLAFGTNLRRVLSRLWRNYLERRHRRVSESGQMSKMRWQKRILTITNSGSHSVCRLTRRADQGSLPYSNFVFGFRPSLIDSARRARKSPSAAELAASVRRIIRNVFDVTMSTRQSPSSLGRFPRTPPNNAKRRSSRLELVGKSHSASCRIIVG